ncbi:hypothetical protein BKA82DRAFT_122595 [Pisolithus tinctorius]|uniref:Phorbol-ester/DAG-type domain-containing protein n=1 Tax=Pisolithus tinctorius Marx 270 TaxID=870435 RepID=A0A0C3JW94_PISTI|nr:hypothetical protein BKA82DRAFT_122595 [Pisolithus tinctorius]KIO13388.1 hypothetical protein M404DRAFT_122595 [Pisolithus tinctorius Marx 270]
MSEPTSKPTTPALRVDTKSTLYPHGLSAQTPSSATPATVQIPLTPSEIQTPPSPHLAKLVSFQNTSHAKDESRKLLALLVDQLLGRPKPPSVFEPFGTQYTTDNTVKSNRPRQNSLLYSSLPTNDDSDKEDDSSDDFSTDSTFELMVRLKEVLLFSVSQGWQIFEASVIPFKSNTSQSPKTPLQVRAQSRRSGIGGKRSKSSSPTRGKHFSAPELLSQCISLLASVISEDCRFQSSRPRPSRPVNSLQWISLDVAQLLVHCNLREPTVISQVAFAVIPAFSTFPSQMYPRLLAFFDNVILRGVLEDLCNERGYADAITPRKHNFFDHDETPNVSIRVVEVPDEEPGTPQQPALGMSTTSKIRSSNAPLQPLSVYHLSAVSSPLLAAVLETVDAKASSPLALHNFYRLIETLVSSKKDSYLDILQIVAYHTSESRRTALTLLATFWPAAMGHIVVSKALPVFSYAEMLAKQENGMQDQSVSHQYAHNFIPWRFVSSDQPVNFQQASLQCCRSCTAVIRGFGLLCTTCMCAVHFDCYDYPDGNVLLEHAATAGGDSGKMVVHRYCLVSPSRLDTGAYHVRKANHNFVLAHIFTLPLCILCRDPIWGFRALLCTSCRLFAHFSCVSSAASEHLHCGSIQLDSSYMTVSLPRLRQSFTDFYGDIFLSSDDLGKRTYEEISVSSSVLWTQLQIYNNGLALGSFSVSREGTNTDDRDFELPYLVELYEAYLSSGKLPVSTSLAEYIHTNSQQQAPHLIMFDWSTLAYIASTVKAPYDTQNSSSGGAAGFLRVDGVGEYTDGDIPRHPYEVVPLGHIYGALGHEFNVVSEGPARHFLSHLQKLGFLCCTNPEPFLPTLSTSANTECYFPLPLGFDLSVDVETLVSAIESCLSDLDLSVNECGLLLLVRRFSPNGLMSEYALHRLTRTLVGWILSEDDSLATILRDYVSGGRRLPGVRAPTEPIPWPYMQDSRRIPTSSVNNGGDYIASRRNLLHTYGGKWLLALHNQDISAYPAIVFDATHEIASDCTCSSRSCYIAERCLKFIVKLSQASVTFTALDDLFLLWLKSLEFEVLDSASMPMLQRLLNRDNDSAARFSTYVDATLTNSDEKGLKMADLWGAVWQFTRRTDGLTSGLMWLRLFARSGVEVDTLTITKYSNIIFSRSPSLAQGSIFMDAVLITTWLRSVGRQDLQPVVGKMMRFFRPAVETSLQSSDNTSTTAVAFVRRALTTCLLLYGCDRRLLLTLDMADKAEVHQLPVRRKLGVRTEKPADPIIIDQDLMFTLDEYFRCGNEEIAGLAAKFLHSFMMNSPYLETFEVDNFVLRNAKALCSWVWQLYGIQQPSVSSIRTSLLSRILVVDVVPFRELLAETFSPSSPWEPRFVLASSRLFRIIMDVKSPTFQVKDRPWKICVLDIFYFFFQLIWLDKKEEIRTAVETWTQTLLTPQLEVIASCWNTALPVLQPLERLQLAVFLTQLQPHFPTWKFLSWDVIIEVLQDDDQTGKKVCDPDGCLRREYPALPLVIGVSRTKGIQNDLAQVALILLSLQMMESGMEVDILSCLKLKYHLAKVLGFSDVESVPTASGRSFYIRFEKLDSISATTFPCVQALPRILDAHHNFDLPPVVMGSTLVEDDKPCRVLVGTIFVDLVLAIFCSSLDLLALPILTLKSLLEALMIITFKHDFGSVAIRHLDVSLRKALRKTLDLLLLDVSYELRQLALSVIQTFIRRGTAITGVLAVYAAAALIIALKHNNEDALVSQAKAFVESTLVTLVPSGIFCSLCKRPPNPDFYEVLKTIIQTRDGRATEASINFQEDLLHSIISQPPEVDWKIIHNTVENINMFVEVVLCEGVSDQTLKDLAAWIVATARRAAGFSADKDFDLNTLLSLTANLLRFKRSSIRHDLIICVETVFRIAALRSTLRKETILLLRTAALTQGYTMSSDITVPATQTLSRIMVEIVDDILRLKVRAIPTTLASLVEVFMSQNVREHGEDDAIQRLARSAIYFLQNHSWTTGEADADLTLSLTAGRYIFYAAERGHDRSFHSEITIRPWIVMLLSAVSTPSSEKYGTLMMSRFDNFVVPYTKTLGTYVQGRLPPPETAAVDIEYTYLAMKSWLLLLHKLSTENTVDPRGELTHKIWNELWPPFESLAKLLGQESSDELLPLSTAVWSSVANLFIFVLQSRSPIAMDCIPCLTLLQHLKQSGRRNSALSKLARALDGNVLPELQLDAIIAQTIKDTANADKLRRLDRHTKAVAERRRVPT